MSYLPFTPIDYYYKDKGYNFFQWPRFATRRNKPFLRPQFIDAQNSFHQVVARRSLQAPTKIFFSKIVVIYAHSTLKVCERHQNTEVDKDNYNLKFESGQNQFLLSQLQRCRSNIVLQAKLQSDLMRNVKKRIRNIIVKFTIFLIISSRFVYKLRPLPPLLRKYNE